MIDVRGCVTIRTLSAVWLEPVLPFLLARLTMFVREPARLKQLLTSLGFVTATALLLAFDSGTTAASCGDYVMVGGHGAGHDASEHTGPMHGHGQPDHGQSPPTCHGRNCHQQTPLPLAPTKGLVNSPPLDSACCSHPNFLATPPLLGGMFERRILLAEGHSLPLLRPPCL